MLLGLAVMHTPRRRCYHNTIFRLWDDGGEETVSFSLIKMVGLQYREGAAQFVLEGVNGFGCDDARDLHYDVFLCNKHVVCTVL